MGIRVQEPQRDSLGGRLDHTRKGSQDLGPGATGGNVGQEGLQSCGQGLGPPNPTTSLAQRSTHTLRPEARQSLGPHSWEGRVPAAALKSIPPLLRGGAVDSRGVLCLAGPDSTLLWPLVPGGSPDNTDDLCLLWGLGGAATSIDCLA